MQIKNDTLKKIENNNKLEIRLKEKGYLLKDKIKEGRKVYYILDQENEYKEMYNNMVNYVYNTTKEVEFTKYFNLRTLTNDLFPLSKADISNKVNVSSRTISNWDNNLVNKCIIYKDGYYYFTINKQSGEIKQCTKQEYNSFWKNKAYLKAFYDLQVKYIKGQLTLTELQLASAEIGSIITLVENKYYFKTKKYKTNKDNRLYIDTFNLIKTIYGNDPEFNPNFEFIESKIVIDPANKMIIKKLDNNTYKKPLRVKKVVT